MSGLTATPNYVPFIESDASADGAQLRRKMDERGYLFFRALVPADDVLKVRGDALTLCGQAGWLDPLHDLMDGVANLDIEPLSENRGRDEYFKVYRPLLKTPSFHDFPTHPVLMDVAAKLLDSEVLVHPRRIGRITFPNFVEATTPAHQDHFYIRGSVDTYSCWIPLGTCPRELGGLAVLPASGRDGFIPHTVLQPGATGGRGVPVDEETAIWHTSDFEIGDALFFHSFTVHKALPNLTSNRLRLSTDNRYQRPKDAIDPGALKPHLGLD